MALSMTQSINFEAGEAKSTEGGQNLSAAQVFENIKQLTARWCIFNWDIKNKNTDFDERISIVCCSTTNRW
jgi:hypothetical protein